MHYRPGKSNAVDVNAVLFVLDLFLHDVVKSLITTVNSLVWVLQTHANRKYMLEAGLYYVTTELIKFSLEGPACGRF